MMMTEKKISLCALALAALLLSSCSSSEHHPQFAQRAHTPAVQSAEMVKTCKQEAAHRYNTHAQRISVIDIEQYQGSVEIKGATLRDEGFTCSFDESGQFLHLSTT